MVTITLISNDSILHKTIKVILNEIGINKHISIQYDTYNNYKEWEFKRFAHEDIIILDADSNHQNSLELIKKISIYPSSEVIVIFKGIEQIKLFLKISVYRYIDRANMKCSLKETLLKLYGEELKSTDKYIELMNSKEYYKIKLKDIMYITCNGKNTVIHTIYREITFRISLVRLYNMLKLDIFDYIDKGCIINTTYVETVLKGEVILTGNVKLPVSRNGLKKLNDILYRNTQIKIL